MGRKSRALLQSIIGNFKSIIGNFKSLMRLALLGQQQPQFQMELLEVHALAMSLLTASNTPPQDCRSSQYTYIKAVRKDFFIPFVRCQPCFSHSHNVADKGINIALKIPYFIIQASGIKIANVHIRTTFQSYLTITATRIIFGYLHIN